MNATTNFTVKSLRANKVRTLVTIAGVALAAALLTAVLTTYVSLNDYLYRSEAHLAGTWMACVEADGSSALDEKIADAQADPQVAGTAIMRDVGFAKLTADQQNTQGTYLAIRSIEGDVGDICGIAPSEGRLPENDHEIMLFSTWNDYGGVNLGDTVTFDVGQRVARLAPGEEGSMSAGTMTASWGVQGEAHESEITDGTPLNSSMGVLEADIDGGIFNEDITNTEESTYTVVGFYDRPGYALSTAAGMVGVTAGGAAPDAFTDVFFTLNDVANTQQVEEAAEALFPDEHVVLHTAMLRYMGVSSDSSIWATFYGLVVVLAAVIVVACVSLIFNAFNISVAERIKQFGLLSSVGASRRQLRRAVVLEGAIVAVIGIPCGLLIGLAGCAATFAALRAGHLPAGRLGGSGFPRGRERLGVGGGLGAHVRHGARVRVDSGKAGEPYEHHRLAAGRQRQPRFQAWGGAGREVHGGLVAVEGARGGRVRARRRRHAGAHQPQARHGEGPGGLGVAGAGHRAAHDRRLAECVPRHPDRRGDRRRRDGRRGGRHGPARCGDAAGRGYGRRERASQ